MRNAGRIGTAVHLAVGLGVLGVAGYAFVAVVGHVFDGPADAGALSALISLYLLVNIIGPGVYAALEQATSRAVSAAAARGEPLRPIARHAGVLALRSFAALVLLVLAGWPPVLSRVLDGRVGLLIALVVAIAGSGAVYWVRGVLGGQQRFTGYAATLYVEGAVRLVPCLVLLVLAVRSPAGYGLAFALGSAIAALSVAPSLRLARADAPGAQGAGRSSASGVRIADGGRSTASGGAGAGCGRSAGPDGPDAELGRSFGYLIGAIALSQLLANLAPVVVTYRSPDDLVAAGVFASTFVLARIPLFLFAPVQAVLLPHLTRAATLGQRAELVRRLRQVLGVVALVGGLGVGGCALAGPWAAELLFNTAVRPTATTVGLLGLATLVMMAALVVQAALVALNRQRMVTFGWIAGTVVYLALLVLPLEPITAALYAQLAGPAVVLAVLGGDLVRTVRAPGSPATATAVPSAPPVG